ncbi:MAG: TonB-dependent receptor [Candidatus Aminicenantes bacterium]|nr:MAG: TonB-dependent receptor [Candidatus Aminicenantes bacterium]
MKKSSLNHLLMFSFILVMVFVSFSSLFSENKREDKDTDLESIWKAKVITPSRIGQEAVNAPANVTVFTYDNLKKMGYNNFVEVLRDLMGMDVNNPGQGQMDFGLRGINARLSMGKYFQVLLDGYDMSWRQFYRNHISTAWISLDAVERIEIIRGPSSALWGANAYLGIINIITKSPEEKEAISVSITGGSFNTYSTNATITKKLGNNGSLSFFSSHYADNIPRKVYEWTEVAGSDVILNSNERSNGNAYMKLKVGDFSLVGGISTADSHQAISTFSVGADYTRFVMDKKHLVLGWKHTFTKGISVRLSGYYDDYSWGKGAQYEDNPYNGIITDPGSPPTGGHFIRQMKGADNVFGVKSQVNYIPSENFFLVGGFEYESRDITRWYYPEVFAADGLDVPKFNTNIWAVFLEGNYTPVSWARLNACFRHDVHSTYESVNSPRLSMILNPNENSFIKILYGTAFKAPSLHELYYFRKNAYYGNPSLMPEKNETIEVQFGYKLKGTCIITASLFDVEMKNVIAYKKRAKSLSLISESDFPAAQRPDGTADYNQQDNVGHWNTKGIELALSVIPSPNLTVFVNGTYRKAKNVETGARLHYTADTKGTFGIRYSAGEKAFLTLQIRYTGDRSLPYREFNEPGCPWQVLGDPTLEAPEYFTVDFAVYFPKLVKGIDLSIRSVNLLDKDSYDPGREVLYSLPSRSLFVRLGYSFNL